MRNQMIDIRNVLTQDAAVTGQVSASDIRVGFARQVDSFPCITLDKVTGDTYGRLGFKTSDPGSRDRHESITVQLDIYTRSSASHRDTIGDYVIKAMMSGCSGARMLGDIGTYDDGYDAYRDIQTWTLWEIVQD